MLEDVIEPRERPDALVQKALIERRCRGDWRTGGINILEARCTAVHPRVKNRFVRNSELVFDAYRVTPTG